MNDYPIYIRLPTTLCNLEKVAACPSLDDDEFAAYQLDFIQRIFGYVAFLKAHGRATPLSDAFLGVFVQLIDVLDANSHEDACLCLQQLDQILRITFPEIDRDDL